MMTLSDMPDVEDLPQSVRQSENSVKTAVSSPIGSVSSVSFEDHERELLTEALERVDRNQSEAARILRISRDRMRYKMAKYNLH